MKKFPWGKSSITLSFLVLTLISPNLSFAAAPSATQVFTLSENLDVDPSTGTSSISIPIEVPQGRAGIQPSIGLLYNSSGGNGILGVGWSMELGYIQRSTKKGVPQYNSTDIFVLSQAGSQQELVDISGNGTEFRPETEGAFMKIQFSGTSWTLTDRKGTKYFFGTNIASRVYDPTNSSKVYRWALERVEDINGNYMTVTYVRDDNQVYPSVINYTGNTIATLPTYAQVRFNYESKTTLADFSENYLAGFKIASMRRIKNIEAYVGTNLVRRYQMNYSLEAEMARSLLNSVTLIGSDGTSTLPATRMTYSVGETKMLPPVSINNRPNTDLNSDAQYVRMIDMNADGKVDILNGSAAGSWQIYFNQSTNDLVNYGTAVAAVNSPNYGANIGDLRVVDMNGDGLMDVVYGKGAPYTIWINNGINGFNPPVVTTNSTHMWLGDQNSVQLIDMNGDGKTDILASSQTTGGEWKIFFNTTGSDFAPGITVANAPTKGFNNSQVQMGDFNGDGLTDVIIGDLPTYKIWINNGVNGFNAPVNVARTFPYALNYAYMQLADMNGDGLTDIVRTSEDSTLEYYIYTNNGKNDFNAGFAAVNRPDFGFTNGQVRLMDINSDRQLDVVIGYPTGTDTRWRVWLNNGTTGFNPAIDLGNYPEGNIGGKNFVFADINADGRMDIVMGPASNWQVWLNKHDSRASRPSSLIDVDNSVGGHLELEYQHLPIAGLGGIGYKTAVSPFLFNSVKIISRRASLTGDVYVSRYDFKGGLWDNKNREFRGFKTVKMIDPDGNYSVTDYAQDDIYRGRPLSQASYDSQNRLFSKSVNIWNNQVLYPNVNFPFLKQTDSYLYDGDATGRRTQTQYFYDESPQCGNLTKSISFGEVNLTTGVDIGTDKSTTEVTYHNNTTKWLLGLPKITTIKDNANAVFAKTTFYYDSATNTTTLPTKGYLTKKVNWAGDAVGTVHPFTLYTYDTIGNLLTTSDSNNSTTSIVYDTTYKLFPLETTNALGHKVTNEYYGINGVALSGSDTTFGLWGQLKSTTDPNQKKGLRIYDTFGRTVKMISPLDTIALPTTSYEYVYGAAQLKVISKQRIKSGATGTIDTVRFSDGLGRAVQSKSKSEIPGKFIVSGISEYNLRGLPVKKYVSYLTSTPLTELDSLDTTQPYTLITYDAMGRVLRTTAPDGSYSNVIYDDWNSTSYDENGHMQKSYADAFGRLIKKEEYLGADGRHAVYPAAAFTLYATTLYTYDSKGNLIKTQDAKGNITTISYDALGRKTQMVDPDMGTWKYGYDVEGNLIWQEDAKGQRINFTYDQINRLKSKTDLSVLTVNYTYDDVNVQNSKGRLTSAAYGGGNTGFAYDEIGRELQSIKTIGSTNYSVSRTYDAVDRLVTLQYPQSTKVGYTYNQTGMVNSVFAVLPTTVMPNPSGDETIYMASPFAQYRLNESASTTAVVDSGIGKTNVTSSANTSTLSKAGKINSAFGFNGTSHFVNMDNLLNKIRYDNKGSFSMWIKPEAGSTLLSFGGVGGYFSMEWYEANQSLSFAVSGGGTPISATTPTGSVAVNNWVHVAVVQDGVNLKIYINGVEQPLFYWMQSNKGAWFSYVSSGLNYGRMGAFNNSSNPTSNNSFFKGNIDDVRYYSNKALIPHEVWGIYNNGAGTEAENPVISNTPPPSVAMVTYMAPAFAQFKLNDNAANTEVIDETVGYNDGVATHNTNAMSTTGKINSALAFNGTNQYVDMSSLFADIRTDTVGTFSLWVKPVNSYPILEFTGSGGYFVIEWYKNNQSATFAISGAGTPIACTTQTGSMPANTYSHLVISQDGTQYKIYINGVLQQNLTKWFNSNLGAWFKFLTGSITNSRLGSAVEGSNQAFFNGNVDDLRYYKKALTLTEIQTLYNNGAGTEEASPAIGGAPVLPPLEPSTVPASAGQVYINNVDYNALGQMTKVEFGNGVVTTYTYSPTMLRLTNITSTNAAGTVLQNFSYTYDGVGNITAIVDAVNTATQTFKYDALNRLTQAVGAYGTKNYTFDQIGNIITKDGLTYTYSKVAAGPHAVTSLSDGTTITYDINGNMTSKSKAGEVMQYFYDSENRLSSVKKNTSLIAEYLYDGDGGRVQKTSYVTTPAVVTKYIGEMYEETDNVGTMFVFLGSQRVAAIDTNSGTPLYYHMDYLGSTNVMSDNNGNVAELIEYDPYGKIQRHDNYGGNTRLAKQQFTGKKLDDETGLIYFGARYYDPLLGRFITADTIVQNPSDPQTLNRYSYCQNNPINKIDPDGHRSWWKKFWGGVKDFFRDFGGLIGLNGLIFNGIINQDWKPFVNVVTAAASAFVFSGNPIAAAAAAGTTMFLDTKPGRQLTGFVASEVMDDMLGMRPGTAQVWARVGLQVAGTLAAENIMKNAIADPATASQVNDQVAEAKAIGGKSKGYDPAGGRYPGGGANRGFDLANKDVKVMALTVKGQTNPTAVLGTGKFAGGTLLHTGAVSSSFPGGEIVKLPFGNNFLNGYGTVFGVCHQATNATLLVSGISSTVWDLAPHWSTFASTITYGNYGGQLSNYVYTGIRTDLAYDKN
ncbi:MAG: VCBS repeat-containing protein [Candidatus Omnitrophica bacterium]|nr:VCBS repeat-containing protein [Candidatus Omnitrophota bacterium]